jgi:SAM-dependent methyltransferase
MLTATQSKAWVDRWDRQQERYMTDREERFAVIADVVEASVGRPDPLVLDIGCGPGSLAARLLDRIPDASVVGIDADPLLLGLAAQSLPVERLRLVQTDLRTTSWADALALPRPADAVVSTTALHWLDADQLAATYAAAASLLRPGGVLVNGDHLFEGAGAPALERLGEVVRERRAVRTGTATGPGEDWEAWWREVESAPELAELVAKRAEWSARHRVDDVPTYGDHLDLLRAAGFGETGTIWQAGDDRVIVAIMPM